MTKYITLLAALAFSIQLNSQPLFRPTNRTASAEAHLKFIQTHRAEAVKRAKVWKVPAEVVLLIASVQAGAGAEKEFNFGAVLPDPGITRFGKFTQVNDEGLVNCIKASRGIELIALALHIAESKSANTIKTDEDYLNLVFGNGGDLQSMADEAADAYFAYYKRKISFSPTTMVVAAVSPSANTKAEKQSSNGRVTTNHNNTPTSQLARDTLAQQINTSTTKRELTPEEREKIIARAHLIASQQAEREFAELEKKRKEEQQRLEQQSSNINQSPKKKTREKKRKKNDIHSPFRK